MDVSNAIVAKSDQLNAVDPDERWFKAIEEAAKTFEINVTNIVNNFTTATAGLPMTERRASIEEITFS